MNRVVLLLTFLSVASTTIAAGTPQNKKKLGNVQATVMPWKPTAFTQETEHLPTGYTGLDPKKFLSVFKSKVESTKKGEFETSEAVVQRTANKDAVLAPINTSDLYAFRIDNIDIKYDADAQAYTIGGSFNYKCRKTPPWGNFKDWFTCKVTSISRESDTYEGGNAFGASLTVERTQGRDFALAFQKDSPLLSSVLSSGRSFNYEYQDKFSVTLEKARSLKDMNVAVLFVGRVSDVIIVDNYTRVEPTIDWPRDIFIIEDAIPFDLKEIIYYVIQTGEILGKKDF
jgi:hypothetical protein